MKKIQLSELLKYGKKEYLSTKSDKKLTEKILNKTVYKKSIFSNIFKYKTAFASVFVIIILWILYNNFLIEKNNYTNHITISKKTEQNFKTNNTLQSNKEKKLELQENNSLADNLEYDTLDNAIPEAATETEDTTIRWWGKSTKNINIQVASTGIETEENNIKKLIIYSTIWLVLLIILYFIFRRKKKN